MERMAWTDERMDDFAAHTYRRFDEVDKRFDRVDADFRDLRAEMNARFERIESRIDDVNRTMLRLGAGAIVTFVVGFAGLIATQL
jgi:hypothetical protein